MVRPFYSKFYDYYNDVRTIVLCIQAPVRVSRDSIFGTLDILLIGYGMCLDIRADVDLLHSS